MKRLLTAAFVFSLAGAAMAAVKTETIDYKDGNTALQGLMAYDDAATGKKPGIVVVHEWWGRNDYADKRAKQLAELGYVAMSIDMYGKGILTSDMKEAGRLSTIYKSDRALMRHRAEVGLNVLAKDKRVDATKLAAMGYCFGGTAALEMARAGFPLKGVAAFHGGLDTPKPEDAKNIKGRVIVFQGGDDNFTLKDVPAFQDEMRNAKADWEMVTFANSVHGFTNPANGSDNSKGMAYNADADHRSWDIMKMFFAEIFK